VPALLLLARWQDSALVVGGIRRTQEAEERVSTRDRELEVVTEISSLLGSARNAVEVASTLVGEVTSILDVGFGGVAMVDETGNEGIGVYAELNGATADWWAEIRVDLHNEPSGIASAVFDAAPVTVYDIPSSPLVSPRLTRLVNAQSGAWIPMIAEGRVIGVLVVAATRGHRSFTPDELALLQATARGRRSGSRTAAVRGRASDALEREQRVADIVRRIRAQLDPAAVERVARRSCGARCNSTRSRSPPRVWSQSAARGLTPGEQFLVAGHGRA
jgi:GAF domain-containing protein